MIYDQPSQQWAGTASGATPTGGSTVPVGWGGGGYTPPGGFGSPTPLPADNQGGAGVVPYRPGPITSIVNDLLRASIGGTSQQGPGQTLNLFSRGVIPPAIQAQYQQNLNQSMGDITEKMGVVGNRFGTDLSRTLADAAGRADVNLSAGAMDRALSAISQILGLGTAQSGLEFTGQQSALDRAHQDFLQANQQSSFESLLPLLLGLG
jgi:hypothetical protein